MIYSKGKIYKENFISFSLLSPRWKLQIWIEFLKSWNEILPHMDFEAIGHTVENILAFYANRPVTGLFQNGYFFNPECCKDWHFRDYHRIKKSRHAQWKIAFISHCVILWNWARVNTWSSGM